MPTILCIDDDKRSLEVLFALLESRHYHCIAAETPIQARAHFIIEKPDLVVIDHGLPGENGASLAAALKNIRNIPILMLTGRCELAKPDKVDTLLIKPQPPFAIFAAIADLLQKGEAS